MAAGPISERNQDATIYVGGLDEKVRIINKLMPDPDHSGGNRVGLVVVIGSRNLGLNNTLQCGTYLENKIWKNGPILIMGLQELNSIYFSFVPFVLWIFVLFWRG
jgi:hypothetical protein